MSKKCIKCGNDVGDIASDYCINCCNEIYAANKNQTTFSNHEDITKNSPSTTNFNKEEKSLVIVGNIVLWLGIITSIILIFVLVFNKEQSTYMGLDYTHKVFRPEYLPVVLYCTLFSIITWAVLLCIAKASKNIREIRNKLLA